MRSSAYPTLAKQYDSGGHMYKIITHCRLVLVDEIRGERWRSEGNQTTHYDGNILVTDSTTNPLVPITSWGMYNNQEALDPYY